MYSLHPTFHTPNQTELSRHAAERYAVLSAVRQRRAEQIEAARRPRGIEVLPQRLAIDALPESPRC